MSNPTQSETLLPCLFCGHDDELQVLHQGAADEWWFTVFCDFCCSYGPTSATAEGATAAWNTRPQSTSNETLLRDRIAAAIAPCLERAHNEYQIADAVLQSIPEPLSTGLVERKGPTIASLKAAVDRASRDGPSGPNLGSMTPAERNKHLFGSEDPARDALAYAYDNGFRWPERFNINHATLSIPRLEAGRVTGSLTLDNASVQRLMDYGLLHYTDEGWVVSKDIWNASAPDGPALTELEEKSDG